MIPSWLGGAARGALWTTVAVIVLSVGVALASGGSGKLVSPSVSGGACGTPLPAAADLTAHERAGQRLMVAMNGRRAPRSLLARVRRGEVGGVILFADNVRERAQVRRLTASIQAAGRATEHQVPLLVAVDQEGGIVKRLPGPPRYSEPQLGRRGSARLARASGAATARSLAGYGINANLAPVLDVPDRGHPTMLSRAYGRRSGLVSDLGAAAIEGMQDAQRFVATAKHFPGLGATNGNTDDLPGRVDRSLERLRARDLLPFKAAIQDGVGMIMTSTAVYTQIDRRPASLSPDIVKGLLRGELGYGGVVISDALETPAIGAFESTPAAAVDALRADVDIALIASATGTDRLAYKRILAAARRGRIGGGEMTRSVQRILDLKATYLCH